ncbi:MAG: hypothetical protein ACJ77A_19170 [Actinomycetota bacterium]
MAEARTGTGGRRAGANRRGAGDGADPGPAASPSGAGAPGTTGAPRGPACPVAFCPVGMALTFAEAARPEVVQHLMTAGHELMLAVKAMVDARTEAMGDAGGLEHIRIT